MLQSWIRETVKPQANIQKWRRCRFQIGGHCGKIGPEHTWWFKRVGHSWHMTQAQLEETGNERQTNTKQQM